MRTLRLFNVRQLALLTLTPLVACGGDPDAPAPRADAGVIDAEVPEADASGQDAGFVWKSPPGFGEPALPADNPMTYEKIALGRHLFYDKRLSGNNTQSCASCHDQKLAFTDGKPRGVGSTDVMHPRGAMSLVNLAWASTFTWAHPNLVQLEEQALVPMFGTDIIELGLLSRAELESKLRAVPKYVALFAAAFPDDAEPITTRNVTRAIASFERTLVSANSTFDRWSRGEPSDMSPEAIAGEKMFLEERFECFHCHGAPLMSDQINHAQRPTGQAPFNNNGLYNIDGKGAYPEPNTGIMAITKNPSDMGKFKAPTLRNIAVTAPYMHDGSIATLSEVLDHYQAGGRTIKDGPSAGVGFDNRFKNEFIHGFDPPLSPQERINLLAFLESLTDEEFLTNPAHANPWSEEEQAEMGPTAP